MSVLKPGTMCIVFGGKPSIRGLIVQVFERLGAAFGGEDTYRIAATMPDGAPVEAIIDRWKLRPLAGPVGSSPSKRRGACPGHVIDVQILKARGATNPQSTLAGDGDDEVSQAATATTGQASPPIAHQPSKAAAA